MWALLRTIQWSTADYMTVRNPNELGNYLVDAVAIVVQRIITGMSLLDSRQREPGGRGRTGGSKRLYFVLA